MAHLYVASNMCAGEGETTPPRPPPFCHEQAFLATKKGDPAPFGNPSQPCAVWIPSTVPVECGQRLPRWTGNQGRGPRYPAATTPEGRQRRPPASLLENEAQIFPPRRSACLSGSHAAMVFPSGFQAVTAFVARPGRLLSTMNTPASVRRQSILSVSGVSSPVRR